MVMPTPDGLKKALVCESCSCEKDIHSTSECIVGEPERCPNCDGLSLTVIMKKKNFFRANPKKVDILKVKNSRFSLNKEYREKYDY